MWRKPTEETARETSFVRSQYCQGCPRDNCRVGTVASWVQTTEREQKSRLCFSARWKAENETQSQILWKVTFQKAYLTAKRSHQETCFIQRLGRKVGFLRIYDHIPPIMRVSGYRHSLPAWPRTPQITKKYMVQDWIHPRASRSS